MADSRHDVPNGDPTLPDVTNAAIAARMDLMLNRQDDMQRDVNVLKADVATIKVGFERARRESKDSGKIAKALANEQLALRAGFHGGWRARLVLVAVASAVGAGTSLALASTLLGR